MFKDLEVLLENTNISIYSAVDNDISRMFIVIDTGDYAFKGSKRVAVELANLFLNGDLAPSLFFAVKEELLEIVKKVYRFSAFVDSAVEDFLVAFEIVEGILKKELD